VQHARAGDVIDERAVTSEKAVVLDTRDPGARVAGGDGPHRCCGRHHSHRR
jgi:hypothetical protein